MTVQRLLFLSGGSRVGQNVLATLAGRRDGLALIATSSIPDEPALFEFDAVHLVPPTARDPADFERRVLALIESERADLVIPCRDDDVVFLASLRQRHHGLAPRLLCGSLAAAEALGDKWLGYRFCVERGLPFVESALADPAADVATLVRDGWLPCVAKPRRGFGSRGIRIVCEREQLRRAMAREDSVIQRFIGDTAVVTDFLATMEQEGLPLFHTFQGVKHSIQALVAPDGSVAHVICTRNDLNVQRAKRVEPDHDPAARALGERCARAFADAGWRGPLNVQCRKSTSGELVIHEFNGRFTGATAVRWHLGFDEVGAAIARFTGFPLAEKGPRRTPAREAHEGLASRSADPDRVETLARTGSWRAA